MTWSPPPQIVELEKRWSGYMATGETDVADQFMAKLCLDPDVGLYWLLRYGLARKDAACQWVFDRCMEVQAAPDGHLDLWSRGHYKSSIITFALTIQDILRDPEITIGIFSHTRPIAKAFLRQIKQEFERNERLKRWFPDVLFADPTKESPKWSEDEGIVVKRKGNPKESTIEAWGLVDGQPTSKHYKLLVYDDVVTRESVTSPEMMTKTTDAMALSFNLAAKVSRRRFIGTRYHFNDSYRTVIERAIAKPRIYPATVDGSVEGEPVFLSRGELDDKRREMGSYTYACQMLLNPTADDKQGFKEEWLQYAAADPRGHNLVIVGDPASKKRPTSDYTSIWVLGLGPDRKVYVHDMVRDRLSLTERGERLLRLHRYWSARAPILAVAWEEYGLQADIEYFRTIMEEENYRFEITPVGGRLSKPDRIRRLVPWFENGRILLHPKISKTDYEGREIDLTRAFVEEEYKAFPVATHDDMLDALARLLEDDLPIRFPMMLSDIDDDEPEKVGANPVTGY